MTDPTVHADLSARVATLEALVSELYQLVGAVAPSPHEAVEASLPPEVVELAAAGRREEAIRRLIVLDGVSVATATSKIDGLARLRGR